MRLIHWEGAELLGKIWGGLVSTPGTMIKVNARSPFSCAGLISPDVKLFDTEAHRNQHALSQNARSNAFDKGAGKTDPFPIQLLDNAG